MDLMPGWGSPQEAPVRASGGSECGSGDAVSPLRGGSFAEPGSGPRRVLGWRAQELCALWFLPRL